MSPQVGYQGHFSPSASQQNQLFPQGQLPIPGGGGDCYPQYSSTSDQFSQGTQSDPSSSMAQANSTCQSSGNDHFLDTANQGNPFLRQGACQVSTSTASDPTLQLERSGKNMQPDRPRTTDASQPLTEVTEESCSGVRHKDKCKDKKSNPKKPSAAKSLGTLKKSDSTVAENSDDDFSCGGQKTAEGRVGRKSSDSSAEGRVGRRCSDSSVGKKQKQTSNKKSPASQTARHSSVRLWSNGDSDSEEDDSDDSDESSDDYDPASNMHWKGRKRKCSRLQSQTQVKRTKRSSVNYNACAFSQYLAHDNEKKSGRKSRPSKNHKNKKGNQKPLIEGVHYIVVGKFKGHKVMLVKVNRVKVNLNERVKVTECQGKVEQGQVKARTRLLGPRCRRISRGTCATDPAFVQSSDKKAGSESLDDDSDASTIVEGDLDTMLCSDDKVKTTETGKECGEGKSGVGEANKDVTLQAQIKDDNSQDCTGLTVQSDKFMRKEEGVDVCMMEEAKGSLTSALKDVPSEENAGNVEQAGGETKKDDVDCDTQCRKEKCAGDVKNIKGNPQNCVTRQDPQTTGSKHSRVGFPLQGKKSVEEDDKQSRLDAKSHSPLPQIPNPTSGDGETSRGGETDLPIAMEVDADSKVAASEPTSRTQSPVSKPGKRPNDLPSFVSEHSQDADCSSLPHSNPDSASSSPVAPSISFTTTGSHDKDSLLHCQLNSDSKLLEREKGQADESKHSSGPFCFQTVCEKVKGVRRNQRRLEPSSDSSDSHACFSEMRAHGDDDAQLSPQSVGFTWKENLTSATNAKPADTDRDRLKKQKQLTTNQRLGVAFLSKRSRRRRNKVKVSSSKGESGAQTNKLMDSLSLLHMATLANLGGEHSSGNHNNHSSSPSGRAKDRADEKENHNTDSVECAKEKKFEWKTFSREDSGWKSCVHPPVEANCDMFKVGYNPDKSAGFGEVGKNTVYNEERKVISGTTEEMCDEPDTFTDVCFAKQVCLENDDEQLYQDSPEKSNDNTVRLPKRQTSKQLSGYRKKRMRRKPSCHNKPVSSKTNKVLVSLDVLHMATLASLGSDLPKTEHCDTSLPRYSDLVSDHADNYEESLIKMSYTSPVHSDLGDLSPPVPLSPEDLSNENKLNKQRQKRPVPCRLKLEEARGTCTVRMAQLRANSAAGLSSRVPPPPSLPSSQLVCEVKSERKCSVIGDAPPSKQPSFAMLSPSNVSLPGHARAVPPPTPTVASGHSTPLPIAPSSVHPTIPDPNKLPTPSIPWHHPLHVFTEGMDGGAWKDRVIHDALREKHQSRSSSLGDKTSPYLGSQHRDVVQSMGDKTSPFSSASPGGPPLSSVSQRDLHRAGETERTPLVSGASFREIQYNHAGERLPPFVSGSHRDLHRVGEKMPPNSGAPPLRERYVYPGGRTPPFSSVSKRDVYDANSKTPPYLNVSQRDAANMVNSKTPPQASVSQRDLHNVGEKTPPFSGISQTSRDMHSAGSNDKTPPYSTASYKDLPRFGYKTPPGSGAQHNRWLCDKSNTDTGSQTHRPGASSDQNTNSQSQRSPRESGLSRTEMIISQMFNLDSSNATTGKSPPTSAHSKSPVGSSRHKLAENMFDSNRWKQCSNPDRDQKESPQYNYRQMSASAKLYTSCSPGKSPAKASSVFFPDQLHSSQKPVASFPSDRYDTSSKSPAVYSYVNQKFPAYSEKYYNSAKSSSTFAAKCRSESARSPSNYAEKNSHAKAPSAYCDNAKSPSACHAKSKSPSSHDLSKSPSAYYNNAAKSPGAYSAGSYSKSPGYSYETFPSPHVKSPLNHSVESYSGSGKSPYSYTPERYGCSPRSAYSHAPEKTMPTARTPYSVEKGLSSSKSPIASSSGSAFNGSGKSPSRMSPRQPSGKDFDNGRHARTDAWPQQSRKWSIGEYLEEVIDSTYAELTPGAPNCLNPSVSDCDSVARSQGQDQDSAKSAHHDVIMPSQAAGSQGHVSESLTRDTSVALDLSACSKKQESVGTGVSSVISQHLPSSLVAAASSYPSSVPAVCTTAPSLARPTWTSIKTDNFENITDDEDEDVIPSSQEYSTSAYRFPGFRRLSSISSSWTPCSLQSQSCVSAASMPSSGSIKDMGGRTSLSGALVSSHGYSSNLFQYGKGMYSQAVGIGPAPRLSSQRAFNSPEDYNRASRHSFTSASQVVTASQTPSFVTSLGTPWRDTQVQGSAASAPIMSQFEPITDSEEEEDGKAAEDSRTLSSRYPTTYPSAAYSSAVYFPSYSSGGVTSSFTSLSSSTLLPSHSKYPFSIQASERWPSSSSSALSAGYAYTASSTGSNIYSTSVTAAHSSVPGFHTVHNLPLAPSSDDVSDVQNGNAKETHAGSFVCEGGGGDKHDDGDPEDGGGRKKGKASGGGGGPTSTPPSSLPSSSSGQSSNQQGQQQRGSGTDGSRCHQSGEREGRQERAADLEATRLKHVLCPKAPPPSRSAVEASAASVGLAVDPVTRAFCSHPADLPDRPR